MIATLTGVPAGFALDTDRIDAMLARRQAGYGRSSRQRLELDRVDVLTGIYRGRTSGAPITLAVWNRDDSLETKPALKRPRPGHGDLAGGQKYDTTDMRPILERASARETAARVAAGGLVAGILAEMGVELMGHVVSLGSVVAARPGARAGLDTLRRRRDRSPFACLDPACEARMKRAVDRARKAGDTLGGRFEVVAQGVPAGLGSLDDFGSRLDARLGAAMLSIPAIKAVEIGDGHAAAGLPGSEVHDSIARPGKQGPRRGSNRAGGVEAGISNGEPIVVRAAMKPLPTLARPLASWDYGSDAPAKAFFERSDVTAVPAASVVGEAMLALVLADALLARTGGDHRREVLRSLAAQRRAVASRFGRGGSAKRR
jgi:chorismate synthase